MFRFLIDECLTPRLASYARSAGYEAFHVNWLELNGYPDRALMPVIIGSDYIFVTNNAVDFRPLYRSVDLHAGLVFILPAVTATRQIVLFEAARQRIEREGDIVNKLVQVAADGTVTIENFPQL